MLGTSGDKPWMNAKRDAEIHFAIAVNFVVLKKRVLMIPTLGIVRVGIALKIMNSEPGKGMKARLADMVLFNQTVVAAAIDYANVCSINDGVVVDRLGDASANCDTVRPGGGRLTAGCVRAVASDQITMDENISGGGGI
jgi:hypothetical protein